MPRNFLVKRTKRTCSVTYRQRNSDDEFDDLGFVDGDLTDTYIRPFNSPDSGYSQSPVAPLNHKEPSFAFRFDREVIVGSPNLLQACDPTYPLSYQPLTPCVSDFSSTTKPPATPNIKLTLSAPPALGTKRPNADTDHKSHRAKKPKAARKLTFEEDNRSPVHGTIIREDIYIGKVSGLNKSREQNGNKLGGDFMCKLCKESYPDPLSLAQHKCSCIVHVEYRCPECDKVFNCPANLASHRRWHKPKPNNNNNSNSNSSSNRSTPTNSPRILPAGTAKDALKHFTSSTVLNIPEAPKKIDSGSEGSISRGSTPSPLHHLMPSSVDTPRSTPSPSYPHGNDTKNIRDDMLYHCDQCGRKFRRPANLRRHMHQHGEEETYPCQYCGRVFNSLTSRAKHVLTHVVGVDAADTTRDFPCGVCGANFQSRVALERHEKMQHTATGEVYPCKYCSSILPTSPGLTRHINKRHPSENRQVILLQMPAIRT